MRAARAADRPAIAGLRESLELMHAQLAPRFFRVRNGSPAPGAANVPANTDRSESGNEALLLVEDERAVRGLCRVVLYDTPRAPLMVPARRAHLEELFVAPEHRRAGMGRALVETAGRWAKERGAVELLLTVWDGNGDAERFYQSLGYRRVSQALAKEL